MNRAPARRLLNAYRSLWWKRPGAATSTALVLLCASISGVLTAVWLHTELAWIPVGFLNATVLALHFAPGDDEAGPGDESDGAE